MLNPKHTYRLNIAIAAAFLAVAFFGVVTYVNTRTIRVSERRVLRSYAVRESTNELLSSIKDMQTGQRGYLLTGDTKYLQPYRIGLIRVETEFENLYRLTKDNAAQTAHLARLRIVYEEKRTILHKPSRCVKPTRTHVSATTFWH